MRQYADCHADMSPSNARLGKFPVLSRPVTSSSRSHQARLLASSAPRRSWVASRLKHPEGFQLFGPLDITYRTTGWTADSAFTGNDVPFAPGLALISDLAGRGEWAVPVRVRDLVSGRQLQLAKATWSIPSCHCHIECI